MSLAFLFHYLMLNMFRMLIHPSSRACDLFVISWVVLLWFDVCWCYVVVWLGWCGIRMQAEALLLFSFTWNMRRRPVQQYLEDTAERQDSWWNAFLENSKADGRMIWYCIPHCTSTTGVGMPTGLPEYLCLSIGIEFLDTWSRYVYKWSSEDLTERAQ